MSRFNPLGERIVVTPDAQEEKIGLIYIPEVASEKPVEGTVVSVGPGIRNEKTGRVIPNTLKKGDRILYGKYGGIDLEVGGTKYFLMRESDVLGILQ